MHNRLIRLNIYGYPILSCGSIQYHFDKFNPSTNCFRLRATSGGETTFPFQKTLYRKWIEHAHGNNEHDALQCCHRIYRGSNPLSGTVSFTEEEKKKRNNYFGKHQQTATILTYHSTSRSYSSSSRQWIPRRSRAPWHESQYANAMG